MSKQTTPYHRLLDNDATPRAFVVLGSFTILVGWMIAGVVIQGIQLAIREDPEGTLSWFGLLATNLTLITLIPLSISIAKALNKQTPGLLSSVVGRLRWRPLAWFALVAFVLELISFAIIQIFDVPLATGEAHGGGAAPDVIAVVVVVLLTSPIQAAGEEYYFRGYLLQAVGSFVRSSAVAVIATGVLFTAAHGIWPWQSPALFVDRLAFGLIAGLLAVRTGGLEAGIASHAANNVVTFLFAAMTDTLGASLRVKDAPWPLVTLDVLKFAAFGAIALWMSGRMKLDDKSELPLTAVPISGPGRV
ncbi:CPBP family intramembrane glutamic endopeptidase [Kribbella sindirgiensis]|uniref:CPBP family intramembrane metalloprotease n=1 Tax=Kribbella sindirgiensis TaxID=1124744 RepID=A0A4R0IK11_9ACTN|nr:type II CAAX endopeptidase family protein [Kribbella sindirgiensis]TCC31458.1 CPBP family intramembrane metalloprotease [Kribbella sindirgiensis]